MKAKLFPLICLIANLNFAHAQGILAIPKNNSITVTKIKDIELNIPIEIDIVNDANADQAKTITLQLDNSQAEVIKRMNASTELPSLRIINSSQTIELKKDETKKTLSGFYITLDRSITIYSNKTVYVKIICEGTTLNTIQISIEPSDISLDDYFNETNDVKLDEVTKVESIDNVLTVSGYKKNAGTNEFSFLKRKIVLKKGEVYTVKDASFSLYKPALSLITVPFKIRPKQDAFKTTASSGLTNIGFNLDFFGWKRERYFSSGKKSALRYGFGTWIAPSVEELDSVYTDGFLGKNVKSKQLFISTGFTFSISYNDVSFVIVPAGWDFATSTIGKNWVYNKQRWWGFGIAISPTVFAPILNK